MGRCNCRSAIVWAISETRRGLALHRARLAEQARHAEIARNVAAEREHERRLKAEEERRRREREEREAAHQRGVADALVKMATAGDKPRRSVHSSEP
jgi:hypothetical protein